MHLLSDKARCFSQSECALYGNLIINNNNKDCTLGFGESGQFDRCEEGAKMEPEITEIEVDRADEEKETNEAIKSIKIERQCSEAAYQDPTTSVAITKTWSMFVGSSTLHGLHGLEVQLDWSRRILPFKKSIFFVLVNQLSGLQLVSKFAVLM